MKTKKTFLNLLLVLLMTLPFGLEGRDSLDYKFQFEINKVFPSISLTKAKLQNVKSIMDVNPHYKPEWVRDYVEVRLTTQKDGKKRVSKGQSSIWTQQQKDHLMTADLGSILSVQISYIPENTLKNNEVKEYDFNFSIEPVQDAVFEGGTEELKTYLQEKVVNNIPDGNFTGYRLAAVKFTVNEEGEVINTSLFESSQNEQVDQAILEAIRNMPCWIPAAYSNGKHVAQDFAFTIGNMESCVVNLLNIKR